MSNSYENKKYVIFNHAGPTHHEFKVPYALRYIKECGTGKNQFDCSRRPIQCIKCGSEVTNFNWNLDTCVAEKTVPFSTYPHSGFKGARPTESDRHHAKPKILHSKRVEEKIPTKGWILEKPCSSEEYLEAIKPDIINVLGISALEEEPDESYNRIIKEMLFIEKSIHEWTKVKNYIKRSIQHVEDLSGKLKIIESENLDQPLCDMMKKLEL
jgi:hypothetical protein